jgi:hypothetical protein
MRKMDAKLLMPFAILLLALLDRPFGTEAVSVSSPTADKYKAAAGTIGSVDSEEEEESPNIEALLDKEDFPVEKAADNANKGMTLESAIALDNGLGIVQPWMASRKLGGIAEEQGIFLRKYGKMSGKVSFDIRDLNVKTAVFSSFLQKPGNPKLLLDVGLAELKWIEKFRKYAQKIQTFSWISKEPFHRKMSIWEILVSNFWSFHIQKLVIHKERLIVSLKAENSKFILGLNAHYAQQVFNYITDLSGHPVCLSRTTVVSIAELGNQKTHQLNQKTQQANGFLARLDQRCHKSKNLLDEPKQGQAERADSDLAYSFGRKGVVQILVSLSGYKCGQSLLEPEKVAMLLENIIEVLEQLHEKAGEVGVLF